MNLILLDTTQKRQIISCKDPASAHICDVLKMTPGSSFCCGVVNGKTGVAKILEIDRDRNISIEIEWVSELKDTRPAISFLIALSRPQTIRKIVANLSEIGCFEICFFLADKSDPAYEQSHIWKDDAFELQELLKKTAEQACSTFLPKIIKAETFSSALSRYENNKNKICLDVYEASQSLAKINLQKSEPAVIAIGPERGWNNKDRVMLRNANFEFAHLGSRVLRVENAASVALAVLLAKLEFWDI